MVGGGLTSRTDASGGDHLWERDSMKILRRFALAFATVATVGTGSVLAFSTTSFGAAMLRTVGHNLVVTARAGGGGGGGTMTITITGATLVPTHRGIAFPNARSGSGIADIWKHLRLDARESWKFGRQRRWEHNHHTRLRSDAILRRHAKPGGRAGDAKRGSVQEGNGGRPGLRQCLRDRLCLLRTTAL